MVLVVVVGVVAVAFGAFDEGVASVLVLDSVSLLVWSWGVGRVRGLRIWCGGWLGYPPVFYLSGLGLFCGLFCCLAGFSGLFWCGFATE